MLALRVVDKSFNYSINRTSKELLYIPLKSDEKFKAKAVIDMFAYRFSKIFGSAIIIPLAAFFTLKILNLINLGLLLISIWVVFKITRLYQRLDKNSENES